MATKTAKLLHQAMGALQYIAHAHTSNAYHLRNRAQVELNRLGEALLTGERVVFLPLPCPDCGVSRLTYNQDFNLIDCASCRKQFGVREGGVFLDDKEKLQ